MKLKTAALTLLPFLFLSVLAACGSAEEKKPDDTQKVTDTEPVSTEEASETVTPLGLPEDLNYGGHICKFTSRGASTIYYSDLWAEALNADTINDAVFNRNKKVEELLNIKLQVVTGDNIREVIMSNEDQYDFLTNKVMFSYAQEGLLLDWFEEMEYVDLDAEWWDADAVDKFKIRDKLFVMMGDISWQSMGSSMAVLFNKKILASLDVEEPYQTVLDGKWTLEYMDTIAAQGLKDLNGDGIFASADDQYGYVSYDWYAPNQYYYSSDLRTTATDEYGEIVLSLNNERTTDVLTSLQEYFTRNYIHLDGRVGASNIFAEGRALFMSNQLKYVSELRDMKDDYGILPFPKYDESVDRYPTTVDMGTNQFGVPVTNGDPSRTSAILEALCYYGWLDVIPTYYNVVLESKYARDSESWKMLDIIHNNRTYDTGFFYANSTDGALKAFFCIGRTMVKEQAGIAFTSYYAKNERHALRLLDEINEAFANQ